MKRRRRSLSLLALTSLFLLSGCMSIVQEMTVHEDGSGALLFALGVESAYYEQFQEEIPDGYILADLFSTLSQDELVSGVTEDHYETDGMIWDSIQLEITDVASLFAEERHIGPLRIALEEEEGVYSYIQSVDIADSTLTIPGVNLMDLTSAGYAVRLTAPYVIDTDGLQEAVGVSSWELSLSELLQEEESLTLWADYSLEPYQGVFIPWDTFFDYIVIGYLGLGVIAILAVVVFNTTGKRRGK